MEHGEFADGQWDGEAYQRQVDEKLAAVDRPHGEADLVMRFAPSRVLDAGCGTGRVARELARRGVEVVGVDVDASMIATAARLAPDLRWEVADLAALALGATFDVVLLAGNVVLFTPPGTEKALVAGVSAHLAPDGHLLTGFQLGDRLTLAAFDQHCQAAGLELVDRWATWDQRAFSPGADYAVSVHVPRGTSANMITT